MAKILFAFLISTACFADTAYLPLPIAESLTTSQARELSSETEASILTILENRFRAEEALLNKLVEDKKESCKKTSLKEKLFGG
jgi:hypothetical protein